MTKYRFTVEVEVAEAALEAHNETASFPVPEDPDLWGVGDLTEVIDHELGEVEIVSYEEVSA